MKPTVLDAIYLAGNQILERALRFEVDWVFIIGGTYLHPDTLVLLRRAGLRVACLLTESPYQFEQERMIAERVNLLFTTERMSVETFREFCPETHYWPHAIDPERHHPGSGTNELPRHDVVFVGTGWPERAKLFGAMNWDGIDFGLYGYWEQLGSRNKLRRFLCGGIQDNEITTGLYRNAKIGLNLHRSSITVEAESMNPRCYELAASGCFFISDYRAELEEKFGELVPTFERAQDAQGIIDYYLEEEGLRREIAAQLAEVVADDTFDARVVKFLEVINQTKPVKPGKEHGQR